MSFDNPQSTMEIVEIIRTSGGEKIDFSELVSAAAGYKDAPTAICWAKSFIPIYLAIRHQESSVYGSRADG